MSALRRGLRRAGPWLTLVLVAAEVVLVWSGLLAARWAVVSGVVVEALLWVTVGGRSIAAARRFRSSRSAGGDLWTSAEDAFSQVVPRPVARLLVLEPRLWLALVRWVTGRDERRAPHAFGYHRGLRVLFWAVVGYTCLEMAVLEVVLAAALRSRVWLWVSLGVHVYAVAWLLGLWASLVTRPHLVDADAVRLRDGVFTEVVIPRQAVRRARAVAEPAGTFGGRTGLKIDSPAGTARLAVGSQTTVRLDLDPDVAVRVTGGDEVALAGLALTADDAASFVAAVRAVPGAER